MDVCRCDHYHRAVENCKYFFLGTHHRDVPRLEVPQGCRLVWKKCAQTISDFRNFKPLILREDDPEDESADGEGKKETPTMWLPLQLDMIEQRYVDETKGIPAPYY